MKLKFLSNDDRGLVSNEAEGKLTILLQKSHLKMQSSPRSLFGVIHCSASSHAAQVPQFLHMSSGGNMRSKPFKSYRKGL